MTTIVLIDIPVDTLTRHAARRGGCSPATLRQSERRGGVKRNAPRSARVFTRTKLDLLIAAGLGQWNRCGRLAGARLLRYSIRMRTTLIALLLAATVTPAAAADDRRLATKPAPPPKQTTTSNPCAAYGPGFVQVEGDTCVKIGGALDVGVGGSSRR
jgi:hypothetical protein